MKPSGRGLEPSGRGPGAPSPGGDRHGSPVRGAGGRRDEAEEARAGTRAGAARVEAGDGPTQQQAHEQADQALAETEQASPEPGRCTRARRPSRRVPRPTTREPEARGGAGREPSRHGRGEEHERAEVEGRSLRLREAEDRAAPAGELEAAHLALSAQPEAVATRGEDLASAPPGGAGGRRGGGARRPPPRLEQAALAERELADAHARLHDLDARLSAGGGAAAAGPRPRRAGRRRPRALDARAAARRGRRPFAAAGSPPAVRTPVAVGALVIVVVASGLLLVALVLKLAIAP